MRTPEQIEEMVNTINEKYGKNEIKNFPYAECIYSNSLKDSQTVTDRIVNHVATHSAVEKLLRKGMYSEEEANKELLDGMESVLFAIAIQFLCDDRNKDRQYPELAIFVERIATKILGE